MTPKQAQKLNLLREKAQWLLSKPILGGYERLNLERIVKRIKLALDPEDVDTIVADATNLINATAECEPLREAMV